MNEKMNPHRIEALAGDYTVLYASPEPRKICAYSPGICRLASGRLVATIDLGGIGVAEFDGAKCESSLMGIPFQGRIFTSDDHGRTWIERAAFPFMHARPFAAGKSVYILGQAGDLCIIRSDDEGETWSAASRLTRGEKWHQTPANVHYANGCVYLVMERFGVPRCKGWNPCEIIPVLMRGHTNDDLTHQDKWTFAFSEPFCDIVPDRELEWHGLPFFPAWYPAWYTAAPGRGCAPAGWLETNVVQFTDPDHYWHDPAGKTFHLWARAHTGITGYACVMKVTEQGDAPGSGEMITEFQTAPSGKKMLYVPCPGGQMKFHVLHDEQTQLYWLLSTQATDSMTRADRLPPERFGLPDNERRRLQLHFSKNMIDWCFAGLVDVGPADNAARHYASMIIDDDDLHVLSRSGDERAKTAHDGNLITFHTVKNFRGLVY